MLSTKIKSFLLIFSLPVFCFPETGLPLIKNYLPDEYKAHGQNWQIARGVEGRMYFANSSGVLIYDGARWQLISLPKNVIVRSLKVDSTQIYLGAQDEFGVLKADKMGILQYYSFNEMVPDSSKPFNDVWQVQTFGNFVYFLSRQSLFIYDKTVKEITSIIKAETLFHTIFKLDSTIYLQQPGVGLMQLKTDKLHKLPKAEVLKDSRVYGILKLSDNKILIGTRKDGLFVYDQKKCVRFKTKNDEWLLENQLYSMTLVKDSLIVLATLRDGISCMDKNGKILLKLNKESGLADNRIWNIYADQQNNLWLALNNGISKVYWPAPFTMFNETNGLRGNVQAVTRFRNRIYAATGYGVFYAQKDEQPVQFKQIKVLDTPSWDVEVINDRLFAICNSGLYEIFEEDVQLLARYSSWIILGWNQNPRILLVGWDNGLVVLQIEDNGEITDHGTIKNFSLESRTLAQDKDGRIWVGTTRHGIASIDAHDNMFKKYTVRYYTQDEGLPGMDFNLSFQAPSAAIFTTVDGVFNYNRSTELFEPNKAVNTFLKDQENDAGYYIVEMDSQNNLVINMGLKMAYFKSVSDSTWKLYKEPFAAIPEVPFYTFYSDGDSLIWAGGPKGLKCFDMNYLDMQYHGFRTVLNRVILNHDSVFTGPQFSNYEDMPEIDYPYNVLRFEFFSTDYVNEDLNFFQFKLEGFDKNWSNWTSESHKDYTNLFEGDYVFKVRSKNVFNSVSKQTQYSFTILPPWYRSWLAYFSYFIFFTVIFTTIVKVLTGRARERALKEQQKIETVRRSTEENLRRQMAADFHDELGNKITRISLFSDLIRKTNHSLPGDVNNYVKKISENARTLYTETRDFVWQLDPQKDALFDTIVRLKNFGDQLYDYTGFEFEVDNRLVLTGKVKLTMDLRRNIIRIMKEAMHNALKHSGGTKVVLKLSEQKNKLIFRVCDNGSGFKKNGIAEGNGIKSMKDRAAKINGHLEIKSLREGVCIALIISTPLGS